MTLREDYAGAFSPDVGLADFSRQALAHLGREYLLNGHLQDRVGLPLVAKHFGADGYVQFSIEEWMAASPIYSLRMQRALGFEGHDVGTVFKNLQLEIGAPQQFMDFRFRLDDPEYGEFWLAHCGALLDIEPFGDKSVVRMCHHIEDPTFDATAAATHPRMRMRPIHRPPRVPADRLPHCRWSVSIGEDESEAVPNPNLAIVRRSKLASIPILVPETQAETGGWPDYSGAFDPDFQLEDLSHRALVIVNQEAAVQGHLLVRSFMLCAAQREGDAFAIALGRQQWTGIAALTSERLRAAMKIEGDDIQAIAKVFQLHPCFHPRTYVDFRVEIRDERSARISIGRCPALEEGDAYSWFAGLAQWEDSRHPALDAIAARVNPRARSRRVLDPEPGTLAWEIVIDTNAEPQPKPPELALARMSRGASFQFETRRGLRSQ